MPSIRIFYYYTNFKTLKNNFHKNNNKYFSDELLINN